VSASTSASTSAKTSAGARVGRPSQGIGIEAYRRAAVPHVIPTTFYIGAVPRGTDALAEGV